MKRKRKCALSVLAYLVIFLTVSAFSAHAKDLPDSFLHQRNSRLAQQDAENALLNGRISAITDYPASGSFFPTSISGLQTANALVLPIGPGSHFYIGGRASLMAQIDGGATTNRTRSIPEFDREKEDFGDASREFSSYLPVYEALNIPSVLTVFSAVGTNNITLSYTQDLRASTSSYMRIREWTNVPAEFGYIDVNFPWQVYLNYTSSILEFAIARDKLSIGPGQNNLVINNLAPYHDFMRLRFSFGMLSHSTWLIRLNPVLTHGEAAYFRWLYDNWTDEQFVEPNASLVPRFFDQSKHFVINRITFAPLDRLRLAFTQTHLIGGRVPQLTDFNPVMFYHNLYEEGQYSVPVSFAIEYLPFPGLKLYGETLIYDMVFGNEMESEESNPNAIAWQIGFNSVPFKNDHGRLRLDAEFTHVMPWVYGEDSPYRHMTSRMIFIDPYTGRRWVDFPLGFYLGPDSLDGRIDANWKTNQNLDFSLSWNYRAKGAVYAEGYGSIAPAANMDSYQMQGLLSTSDTQDIYGMHRLAIKAAYTRPLAGMLYSIEAWGGMLIQTNINHQRGDNNTAMLGGIRLDLHF